MIKLSFNRINSNIFYKINIIKGIIKITNNVNLQFKSFYNLLKGILVLKIKTTISLILN